MDSRDKLSSYNERGEEIPDPRPTEMAINFKAPQDISHRIDQLVKNSMIQQDLANSGLETFAEADDFDTEDFDSLTPYEDAFDPLHTTAREQEVRAGFVEEIPREVLDKARDLVAKAKRKAEAINKPEPVEPKEVSK